MSAKRLAGWVLPVLLAVGLSACEASSGVQPGVVIVEGIQPNTAFAGEAGINTLTSAESPAPYGGAAFHDNHVWIRAGASG